MGMLPFDQLFKTQCRAAESAFASHCATVCVCEEILNRCQKKRTQTSFLRPDGIQAFSLKQKCKKALGKILSFFWGMALAAHKAINRPPIVATKVFERFASL